MEIPLCPVCHEPAVRLIQWVTTRLLKDLWRIEFGVDATPSFGSLDRFGLWESPLGLYFFDPLLEGDQSFYRNYYKRLEWFGVYPQNTRRAEFHVVAKKIQAGEHVLDIGCRTGEFRHLIRNARYVGLEPNFTANHGDADIRAELLETHVLTHAASYDAVCAFQVLEHLSAPAAFFQKMVAAARPGGKIFVGVPHRPSVTVRIPNFLLNAPPHHLTWWTKEALAALAKNAGAEIESIELMPWSQVDSIIYWIERCSIVKSKDIYFKGDWYWHGSSVAALLLGLIANRFMKPPTTAGGGSGLLLNARRPA